MSLWSCWARTDRFVGAGPTLSDEPSGPLPGERDPTGLPSRSHPMTQFQSVTDRLGCCKE